MDSVELYRSDGDVEVVLDGDSRQALMRLRPLPAMAAAEAAPPSSAFLAALHTLGLASPDLQTVLREAASKGEGLTVAFPAEVVASLRSGAFHLMQSADGTLPVAVDSADKIAAHARLVGSVTAGGAGGAVAGATVGAVAIVALPILMASAAAYAQQRQLEKSLASIQDAGGVPRHVQRERIGQFEPIAMVGGGSTPRIRGSTVANRGNR